MTTCAWTAASNAAWASITAGASGTGSGTVQYAVAANTSIDSRTAVVTIGDQTHTIVQAGQPPIGCTYALSPSSALVSSNGRTDSFTVEAPDTCPWTAQSTVEWLTIQSGNEGTGNGTVVYRAEGNPDEEERTATIEVAGETFTLRQEALEPIACSYTVNPVELTSCMAEGVLVTQVDTQASCTWTVTSNEPWLTIESAESNTGPGAISVRTSSNYDAPRSGLVMVRWPTETAGQNVIVSQAGCQYGTSRSTFDFTNTGGSGTFNVVQQSVPTICGGPLQNACVWTATSTVPWIVITTPMTTTGDGTVGFTVAPHTGTQNRTGTILVRDQVVVITQTATP